MKWSVTLAFAAALLAGSQSTAGGDKHSPAKQLQFNLRVIEGDPLGSREAGTFKVLAEPRIITRENRPFVFILATVTGGEGVELVRTGQAVAAGDEGLQLDRFGRRIEGKPGAVKEGKVHLDLTLSNTTIEERTARRTQVHTESMRTIAEVRLGEVVKFRWAKGSADRQVWLELMVEQVKP